MLPMLPLLLLLLLSLGPWAGATQTERHARSDVRTMMDKLDPNFWPTRGRRSSSSSEETPPPFWANRGRALDDLEAALASGEAEPPFWANRGRQILCPEKGTLINPLSVDEPRWVMFNRRDAEEAGPGEDALWITQGPRGLGGGLSGSLSGGRDQEFWVSRGKKVRGEKKDSLRALAGPQDDFYPSRGKRVP